jgi:hypothetical protein
VGNGGIPLPGAGKVRTHAVQSAGPGPGKKARIDSTPRSGFVSSGNGHLGFSRYGGCRCQLRRGSAFATSSRIS